MAALDQFTRKSTDWRGTIRRNKRRSNIVIAIFLLIYASIGFIIDILLTANTYPDVGAGTIAKALLTLNPFPTATLLFLIIAVIALWITYKRSDKLMLLGTEAHQITETSTVPDEKMLYNVIEEMKVAAGLRYMPKVYIIEAPYMNAFASGYSEKSAMVAITRGLLDKLDRAELTAVMAHELSHVRHLDIKITLTATMLANIMVIAIDLLFYNMSFGRRSERSKVGNQLALVIILLRYLLPLITMVLMLFLSRNREYMADAGCVELMRDNEPLAKALMKISGDHRNNKEEYAKLYAKTPHEQVRREAYLYDPKQLGLRSGAGLSGLFSTHPTLEQRLKALGFVKRK